MILRRKDLFQSHPGLPATALVRRGLSVGLWSAVPITSALMVLPGVAAHMHAGTSQGSTLDLNIIPATMLYGLRQEPEDRKVLHTFQRKHKRW